MALYWRCYHLVCVQSLSHVQIFATHLAPLFMKSSRQEYGSGLPFQRIFPSQGSNLCIHESPALASRFFTTAQLGEPHCLLGAPGGSDNKESACIVGDLGSIPVPGRSSGEVNGNPLQYCCLGNPVDRGAWQATVHGITKSQTQLSNFHFHFHFYSYIAGRVFTI